MTAKARQKREYIKQSKGESIRVIILGAGGRDFHNSPYVEGFIEKGIPPHARGLKG